MKLMVPPQTLACARRGGSRGRGEGRRCRSILVLSAQDRAGSWPSNDQEKPPPSRIWSEGGGVSSVEAAAAEQRSQEHEELHKQPFTPWVLRQKLRAGVHPARSQWETHPPARSCNEGGGRSASRFQRGERVASPRVCADKPHTPRFLPSRSVYSRQGRTHLQLAFSAREGRVRGCSTAAGVRLCTKDLKGSLAYEKKERNKKNVLFRARSYVPGGSPTAWVSPRVAAPIQRRRPAQQPQKRSRAHGRARERERREEREEGRRRWWWWRRDKRHGTRSPE